MANARKGRGGQTKGGARKSQKKSQNESVFENPIQDATDKFFICLHCEEGVEEGQDAVQCFSCKSWSHKDGCTNLSDRDFSTLCDSKSGVDWICQLCRAGKNNSRSNLEAKIDRLISLVESTEKRLNRLENGCSSENLIKMIDQRVNEKVEEVWEERVEREKRELNLVISNLEESSKADKIDKNKEELENVTNLVKKIYPELKDGDLEEPTRLGKVNLGSRPRLLRIRVNDKETKNQILKNAKKLNSGIKEPSEKKYINPDYTPSERLKNKQLREELKGRIDKGERDIGIRGGKIVQIK